MPEHAPQIIVFGGQSNMAGLGDTAALTPGQRTLPPGVSFIDAGRPAPLAAGRCFGPEVGFAHALAAARPGRPHILVKWAIGGTSMAAWAPQYDPQRARLLPIDQKVGHLYPQLVGAVRAAMGTPAQVAAFLWMQGEADCRIASLAAAHRANLGDLIAGFRADCAAPLAPFILGLVNPPPGAMEEGSPNARYPHIDVVREAQRQAAATIPGTHLVQTDDLPKNPDNLHYSAAGQLELGRRMAASYLLHASAGA